jgi:hypothetical protein
MNPDKLAKIRKAFDTLKSNELLTSADLSTIGKQGERGERGTGFRWRGKALSTSTYQPMDVVHHKHSAYVCTKETSNLPPLDGWEALVVGSVGPQGLEGKAGPQGVKGESIVGATGPQGKQGPTGVQGRQGVAGVRWVGNYAVGREYEIGDLVMYGGTVFLAFSRTSAEPTTLNGWAAFSARGDRGPSGFRGETGPSLDLSLPLVLTNTTASTSSTTGAIIIAGGAGIAKDSFINGQRIGLGLLADQTNLAVGKNALQSTIAAGINNTAIGSSAGEDITSGSQNTFLGFATGSLVTTGSGNCCIGYASLNQNQSGSFNTAMGYGALQNTTVGNNTAVGLSALGNITTGTLNTAIGREAGCFQADGATGLTTATNSVYIGRDARGTQTDNNSVVIGYEAIGIGLNTIVIGTTSTTANRIFGVRSTGQVAPTIASASTISPTKEITFVSGTTAIVTITAPTGIATTGGQIIIIPTGLFTTTTAGNIALASTAVVSRALIMHYDATAAKWYPSY